jgi:hypothetical protein
MRTRGSGYRGETPRSSCWFILAPVCCGPCVAPVPAVARDRPTAHLSVTQLDHNLCYQRNSMRDSRFQSISSCGQRYPRSTAGADGHTCIVSQPLPRQSHPVIAGALDQYCDHLGYRRIRGHSRPQPDIISVTSFVRVLSFSSSGVYPRSQQAAFYGSMPDVDGGTHALR